MTVVVRARGSPREKDTMRLHRRHDESTARRLGHHAADCARCYDEAGDRWFPVSSHEQEMLEIELEDVGGTSWWVGLATTLGYGGAACMRFVARAPGHDGHHSCDVVKGETFLRPRSLPDDLAPQESWSPGMNHSLHELRQHLQRDGWVVAGKGQQPWAYRYIRPAVDLTHPLDEPWPSPAAGTPGDRE